MGYSTEFEGRLHITGGPLPQELADEIRAFSDGDHRDKTGMPGFHCDFTVTKDNAGIEWNGAEKTYEAVEWVQYLYDTFLYPNGYGLSGTLNAFGEERGDVWRLVFQGGRSLRQNGRLAIVDEGHPVDVVAAKDAAKREAMAEVNAIEKSLMLLNDNDAPEASIAAVARALAAAKHQAGLPA